MDVSRCEAAELTSKEKINTCHLTSCWKETLVCIKRPRSDTNERGEHEVTVTSKLHAQAERTNKQIRLHPLEAKPKTQTLRMVLKHGGVTDESGRDRGLGGSAG